MAKVKKIKLKTHSSSKKRFNFTATGKIKRAKAYKRHILTSKTTKRKRGLRKSTLVSSANYGAIKLLIPAKLRRRVYHVKS